MTVGVQTRLRLVVVEVVVVVMIVVKLLDVHSHRYDCTPKHTHERAACTYTHAPDAGCRTCRQGLEIVSKQIRASRFEHLLKSLSHISSRSCRPKRSLLCVTECVSE